MEGTKEKDLIHEATTVLGGNQEVIAAGIFGLADLRAAQVVGGTAGAVAGGVLGDAAGAFLGTVLGGLGAKKAAAEERGATIQLLVAITADTIYVLNRETGGRLDAEYASFPRATTEVAIEKVGASRHLTLTDPAVGASVMLHGAVGWLSSFAEGDKLVLDLLAGDAAS